MSRFVVKIVVIAVSSASSVSVFGIFQYLAGLGWVLKKSWVAGGFGSGRSVEVFNRVFLGYIWICRAFPGILGTPDVRVYTKYWVYQRYHILPDILGYLIPIENGSGIRKMWGSGRVLGTCWARPVGRHRT